MILTTDRLLLREFQDDDWPAVHAYAADPEAVRYMPWGPNTEEETRQFIQCANSWVRKQPQEEYPFALVLKRDGRLIGACDIFISPSESREAHLGYILHPDFWGQGYMPEAARAVLKFGFEEVGLHRIYAECHPQNTASARVMEKIGMRREGNFKENDWIKGQWQDSLLYAILDWEWQAQNRAGIFPAHPEP